LDVLPVRSATIKSVAQKAGVSTATVARVMHDNGYVAEETRARVLKVVSETGYRINSIARSLKRKRSNIIGHLLQSMVPNPFFVKVARGVEAYTEAQGYTTLTYNVQGDPAAERRGLETFLSWRVDAIIFSTARDQKNVEFALKANVPVIQVERPRSSKSDRITVNNYSGAQAAMEHLLELGHRRIAYVGQKPGVIDNKLADYVDVERFGAYQDTLKKRKLFDDRLVALGKSYTLGDTSAQGDGYHAMRRWLDEGQHLTAVFAGSDILAAGVLQAVHEHGLRVPQDISVIGYDDTFAPFLAPLLTTVRLPAHELGETAARLAIERLNRKGVKKPKEYRLETELIVRKSTAKVRS
jgi:DNA-binding LacI/PurR family transcriptional regulator